MEKCKTCNERDVRYPKVKQCKPCYNRDWYREHGRKKQYHKNLTPEQRRDSHLRHKYGVTAEEYDAQLAAQNNGCAICGKPAGQRRLAVDHDHETGKVRGILCINCNQGLGKFLDDPALLEKAIAYLKTNGAWS